MHPVGQLQKEQWRSELVDAFRWEDEERARHLVATLGKARSREARATLEEMLESPDGKVRQAAVFALGELGGPASTRRLEQQLVVEETRGDHDGSAVVQVITQALGQIKSASARAALVRKLNRIATGGPDQTDVNDLAYALWHKRHPDLIPAVRGAVQRIALPTSRALHALLRLLESSPEELSAWVEDRRGAGVPRSRGSACTSCANAAARSPRRPARTSLMSCSRRRTARSSRRRAPPKAAQESAGARGRAGGGAHVLSRRGARGRGDRRRARHDVGGPTRQTRGASDLLR
ncbi:hypothetical protein D187_005067 [Cystobacter fuscus DSM 2262]|uniref:HEAT repeat domain-containing protein n=1 Tax=Cystobacter fuscus (strain ATCC 25194 / DSM 2262 / NBRC 100088 / M29) TaxID=1242864 RepID=S9QRM2_CYSF2|nr:hypothetical protein D187_005067 [Cystobacter fuscus DSM 2262]